MKIYPTDYDFAFASWKNENCVNHLKISLLPTLEAAFYEARITDPSIDSLNIRVYNSGWSNDSIYIDVNDRRFYAWRARDEYDTDRPMYDNDLMRCKPDEMVNIYEFIYNTVNNTGKYNIERIGKPRFKVSLK